MPVLGSPTRFWGYEEKIEKERFFPQDNLSFFSNCKRVIIVWKLQFWQSDFFLRVYKVDLTLI